MFDIGWPELMVIAIVLIVVVGPKDLPRMLRTFGKTTGKLRAMAGDFRRQFDDALKEAELDEVKSVIDSARKLDPSSEIRKQLNPLAKIGDEIKSDLSAAAKPAQASPAAVKEADKPANPAPKPEEKQVSKPAARKTVTKKPAAQSKAAKAKTASAGKKS